MAPDKGLQVLNARTEPEDYRQLQQKPQVEVAEISTDRIQQQDVLDTPFKHTLFAGTLLNSAIKHFADE